MRVTIRSGLGLVPGLVSGLVSVLVSGSRSLPAREGPKVACMSMCAAARSDQHLLFGSLLSQVLAKVREVKRYS